MNTIIKYEQRHLTRIGTPVVLDTLGTDEFSGYASLFNIPDGSGDIVAKGAFLTSLKKRPPRNVRLLYQHIAHEPIGVWKNIHEDNKGLFVHGHIITETARGRDVMALIREGAINGLSIGFRTIRATRDPVTRNRILKDIELWEISIVTFPLLKESQVFAVGARHNAIADHIRATGQRLI